MSFRVWLKANAADKVLAPLREELVALFDAGASVLDIGCGTGDLLFRASNKIGKGHGIDLDRQMIQYANNKLAECSAINLRFDCLNALELAQDSYDVVTSTLCLHEMDGGEACDILRQVSTMSGRLLIADYAEAHSLAGRIATEFDEMISGHYSKFRRYRQSGRIPAYARTCNLEVSQAIHSSIDGIVIWELQGKSP